MPRFKKYDYETVSRAIPPPFNEEFSTKTGIILDPIVDLIYELLRVYEGLDPVKKAGKRRLIEGFIDEAINGMDAFYEKWWVKMKEEQYEFHGKMFNHKAYDWLVHREQEGL